MPKGRPVINLTTGEQYPSLTLAAQAYGIPHPAGIASAIARGGKCRGYRWGYVSHV